MKKFISEKFIKSAKELSKENDLIFQNELKSSDEKISSDGDDDGDDLKDFIVDDEDEEEDFEDDSYYGSEISDVEDTQDKRFRDDNDLVSIEEHSIVEILDSDDEPDEDILFLSKPSNVSKLISTSTYNTNESAVKQGRYSEDYDIEDYDPEEVYRRTTSGQNEFPYASLETDPSFPHITKHYW
jgi:hypothetical protein